MPKHKIKKEYPRDLAISKKMLRFTPASSQLKARNEKDQLSRLSCLTDEWGVKAIDKK